MNIPADLKYTEDHEWVRVENGNIAVVGITDFAQKGADPEDYDELVYVEVETEGETLSQGEEFGTVEAVKTTSELFMPVSGKVIAVNAKLTSDGDDDPTLVNRDPYGDGWIIKVEMTDPDELSGLLDAEAYEKLVD